MEKRNGKALLPIFVFVVLYLGLGILFEYGLRIEMGFYKIPVVVIFLIALLVACLQNRALQLNDKLAVMGTGISDPNIITMILIFMLAGIFVGVVGRSSANSVAYFILSLIPPQFAVAVLFIVSCLVSLAMGTSVGTITLIVPIGIAVAKASGFSVPLCIASVMSGAMFGDNLSFISDTTIAACNGQGCKMTDKFKENFFIALPAAIVSVIIIFVLSVKSYNGGFVADSDHSLYSGTDWRHRGTECVPCTDYRCHQRLCYHDCNRHDCANRFAWAIWAPVPQGCLKLVWLQFWLPLSAHSLRNTAALPLSCIGLSRSLRAEGAVCSAWAYWSGLWISQPQIIPLPSLWQTPSQRKCPRTTASAAERLPPFWIPSPVYFRVSCPTARRCSLPSPPHPVWAKPSTHLKSCRSCSILICCSSALFCSSFSERKSRNKRFSHRMFFRNR